MHGPGQDSDILFGSVDIWVGHSWSKRVNIFCSADMVTIRTANFSMAN